VGVCLEEYDAVAVAKHGQLDRFLDESELTLVKSVLAHSVGFGCVRVTLETEAGHTGQNAEPAGGTMSHKPPSKLQGCCKTLTGTRIVRHSNQVRC
jgi:hypothetical protein